MVFKRLQITFLLTLLSFVSAPFLFVPKTYAQQPLPPGYSCSLNGAKSYTGMDNDGNKFRSILVTIGNGGEKSIQVIVQATNTKTGTIVKQEITVAGTNDSYNQNIEYSLPFSDKIPGGNYQVQLILKAYGQYNCNNSPWSTLITMPDPPKEPSPSSSLSGVGNPVKKYSSLGAIFTAILPDIFAIAGMIAFIFIVIGGVRYALARGDFKAIDSARSTITNAIIGLIIILVVFAIFEIITNVFHFTLGTLVPSAGLAQSVDIGCAVRLGNQCIKDAFPSFGALATTIIALATGLVGVIFVFMLIWGGIRYMLARGDEKEVSNARTIITSATIGLLIVVAAFAIIGLIGYLTGQNLVP